MHPKQRATDRLKQVTAALSTSNEVTESGVSTQHKQTSRNENYTDVCSIFGDGLIAINKKGQINFINKIACKLTGWAQREAENQLFTNIFKLNANSTLDQPLIRRVIEYGQLIAPTIEQEIQTKNNNILPITFSLSPLDENTAILIFRQFKHANDQIMHSLIYQANYDSLTRVLNRTALQTKLKNIHLHAENTKKTYSTLLLDIDRFKLINDSYGQMVGDKILQLMAERIQVFIRDNDIAGRWAGAEFFCILPDTKLNNASIIAERLRHSICEKAFIIDDEEIFISSSIGIANYPHDGNSPEELFCVVDATLYEAKSKGRNRTHNSLQATNNIFSVGSQLEKALNNHRIVSVHQPIVNLSGEQPVAEEALARILEEDGSLLAAGQFIDAAVKLQLVHRIDFKIIRSTIVRSCMNYAKNGSSFPLFVNISADFLRRPELVREIVELAKRAFIAYDMDKLDKKPLVIEITEQELLHDIEDIQRILAPLIELGLELAIDDFGSGYSSLTYLSDLPISYLKYDGSLIKRIATEERAKKIITGIQRMAESLELVTIAEHIEDEETANALREIGVTWGQGYYYGQPSKKSK